MYGWWLGARVLGVPCGAGIVGVLFVVLLLRFVVGDRLVVFVAFLRQCVTEDVHALTACPAGGHFLYRQKVTKERLKGFALENPTRGFPLDLPADGANAPYPLIPAGLFVFPAGGVGWDRLAVLPFRFTMGWA